jgi:hypothetical protein
VLLLPLLQLRLLLLLLLLLLLRLLLRLLLPLRFLTCATKMQRNCLQSVLCSSLPFVELSAPSKPPTAVCLSLSCLSRFLTHVVCDAMMRCASDPLTCCVVVVAAVLAAAAATASLSPVLTDRMEIGPQPSRRVRPTVISFLFDYHLIIIS